MIDLILTWLSRRSKVSTGKTMRGDYYCLDCGKKNCKNPAHKRFSKVKPLICPACEQADCLNDLISEWLNMPEEELDSKLTEFIESTKGFVSANNIIRVKSHILDNDLRAKLANALTRLAPKYIGSETEKIILKWERMTDEEVELEFIRLHEEKGRDEMQSIWVFIYPEELKSRLEKIMSNSIPKTRHIDLLRMLKKWESLPDEDLAKEVKTELEGTGWNSSTSHFTFVKELYPSIEDTTLRRRVDSILLSSMDPKKPVDSDMALYACSHLNIPGTVETYQELVRRARQETKKA